MSTNVQVAVRCRPMNAEEKKTGQPTAVTCDTENKCVSVNFGPPGKKVVKNYNFDMLFGMYSTQDEVFQTVAQPIVDEALAGFNCTIFAYGQTGALILTSSLRAPIAHYFRVRSSEFSSYEAHCSELHLMDFSSSLARHW